MLREKPDHNISDVCVVVCKVLKKKTTPANSVKEKRGRDESIHYRYSHLDGVLASPLSGRRLVSCSVGLVDVGDFGSERIVRVGICKHGADREEDCVG